MENNISKNHVLLQEISRLKAQLSEKEKELNRLREETSLFQALIDAAPDCVYWINPDGTLRYVSPICESITGYPPDEFIKDPDLFFKIIHPKDRKATLKKLHNEFKNPEICTQKFRIITKSGGMRRIWHQCKPVYDESGKIIGRRASNWDIPDLKSIEAQLQENQQMLRMVLDGMPDPIHMIDKDFNIVLANKTLLNLKKVSQEEIIGKHCYEIYQGRKEKCEPCAAEQTFKSGEITSLIKTLSLEDGSSKYFEVFAYPIKNEKGNVTHVIELTRDITEQIRLENDLRKSRNQYLQLANSAPLGILSCDTQGNITFVNPAMLDILGSPSLELTKRFNVFTFPPLKEPGISKKIKQTLKTGKDFQFETNYTSQWGKDLALRVHVSPILQADGSIEGALVIVEDFKEYNRLQNAIAKSEQKFHNLFEFSPNGIVLIGTDFKILDINRSIEQMTGYDRKEFVGKYIWEVNALLEPEPKDPNNRKAYFEKLFSKISKHNKYPYQLEREIRDKNGQIHYWQEYFFQIKVNGDFLLVSIKNDVTEQRLAKKALKDSETKFREMYRLFRLIADNDPDMLWAKDLQGRFIFTNKAICDRLLGAKDVNEPIGKDDLFFAKRLRNLHPENPEWHNFGEACLDSDKITLEARKPMHFEEYGNVMGKFMFLDVHKAPLRDEQGNIIGTVGSARDVTEEKQMEKEKEAIQAEVKRLATVIEQTDVAVIITDINGTIQYANRAFEKDTGYSPEEAIGQNPRILKSGEHPKEFYEDLWATITSGKTWHNTIINKKKDGNIYYEDAIIFPLFDSENKITNYAGILRDITKEKELEKQVRQMQKMESIGVLTGGIAHDFNNLLTVINGYTDLGIAKYGHDAKIRSILTAIQTAGNRAAELTSQLLAFSRKQIISPKVLDINETILRLKKMLKRIIEENIELEIYLKPNLPKIKADPVQIEQILMNLVVNARDAIHELPADSPNDKRIQIETNAEHLGPEYVAKHKGAKVGDYISIMVSDSGVGMDDLVINKIFDPFFTTKEVGKGTGLGLSTVYGIVKQNNGNIYVYSEVGKGTTIKIYWPVSEETESKNIEEEEIDYAQMRGTETVLLVEDDQFVREVGKEALEEFGYKVITAANGPEALELIEKQKIQPTLLITDLIMPNMSGKELAKRIKEIFPSIKIIFSSGYTENLIVKNGVLEKGIHFIHKPYQISHFIKLVRQVLDSDA